MMIEIRPIKQDEWIAAKRLIYAVAKDVFSDPLSVDEIMKVHEARGALEEMDDIRANYFDNGGIFLVTTDRNRLIGTGAIRRMDDSVCELKRLWLLTEYQGKGLGYRMMQELLKFARDKRYRRIRLETDPIYQRRAIDLYKRLGFHEIPTLPATEQEDILMEMIL